MAQPVVDDGYFREDPKEDGDVMPAEAPASPTTAAADVAKPAAEPTTNPADASSASFDGDDAKDEDIGVDSDTDDDDGNAANNNGAGAAGAAGATSAATAAVETRAVDDVDDGEGKGAEAAAEDAVIVLPTPHELVTWARPLSSAAVLMGALFAVYMGAFALLEYVLLTAVVAGGVRRAYTAYQPDAAARVPAVKLPISKEDLQSVGNMLASVAFAVVEQVNNVCEWKKPMASGRALVWTWLLFTFGAFSEVLASRAMQFALVAALFAGPIAYANFGDLARKVVAALVRQHVLPVEAQVKRTLSDVVGQVKARTETLPAVALQGAAVLGGLVVVWLWNKLFSLSSLLTTAAVVVTLLDLAAVVTSLASADGGGAAASATAGGDKNKKE